MRLILIAIYTIILLVSCRRDNKQKEVISIKDMVEQRTAFNRLNNAPYIFKSNFDVYAVPDGDTHLLINDLDISKGNLDVLIETTRYIDSKSGLRPEGFYYSSDDSLIRNLFSNLMVKVHRGDCCTPNGYIQIFRNDTCIFKVGILHKPGEGFQGGFYAYSEPIDSNTVENLLRPLTHMDKIKEKASR